MENNADKSTPLLPTLSLPAVRARSRLVVLAREQLQSGKTVDGAIPLPADLGEAKIEWIAATGGQRQCAITFDGHTRSLTFNKSGKDWSLGDVR